MSSQRQHSSILEREQERYLPWLSAGGVEWDLSNLCDGNTSYHLSQSVRSSRSEAPLYPSIQEGASIPDINVLDAFEKAAAMTARGGRDPSRHTTSLLMNPGAARPKQPPESNVGFDSSRLVRNEIQFSEVAASIPSRVAMDDWRFAHMHHHPVSSASTTNISPIPMMMKSTDDSSQRKTTNERLQVQISPGEYMPLRGAQETWEAINNGSSRIVDCVGCQSVLQCVSDCQLVICPDCKLVSPVSLCSGDPENQIDYYNGMPRCPTIWQDDEKKEYPSAACSSSRERVYFPIGGIGLGMKV
jgi:hypothetical protein